MALFNKMDPRQTAQRLERWLSAKVEADDVSVDELAIPRTGGFSMSTVLFRARWTGDGGPTSLDLVARVAPTGQSLFQRNDLEREFKLLRALAGTDVRVPLARWFEPDKIVLGAPFLVMDRVFGSVPSDDPPYVQAGWVVDLGPDDRGRLYDETLQMLVVLHGVDWSELQLDCHFPGSPGAAREMIEAQRMYDWVRGEDRSRIIDAAFEVLKTRVPSSEGAPVLNWGDARIGNVIFDPATAELRAMLDWEMATIASPAMDMGWFLFMSRYYSEEGVGISLPGFPPREQLIARYESLSGRTLDDIDFYEAFAGLRQCIVLMRIGRLMIAAGALPPDSPMPIHNPHSHILAGRLDLSEFDSEIATFIGHR